MSEFVDQVDGSVMICPYCGESYQPETEDYSEDECVEECGNCHKKYHSCQSFSVDHCSEPDCSLNGEKHKWESYVFDDGHSTDFCSICGQIRK